jgi:hypothetical protein
MDLTKNIKIKPYGGLGSVLWYNGIFHIGGTGVYLINTATAN